MTKPAPGAPSVTVEALPALSAPQRPADLSLQQPSRSSGMVVHLVGQLNDKVLSFLGPATAALLDFFERFDEQKYGTDGGPLHDPCVIAWLLHPELFTSRDVNVCIECESELTMGMTVIDWWRVTSRKANATVCGGVNADGLFDLLTKRLATLA